MFVSIVLVFINMKTSADIDYRTALSPYGASMSITKILLSSGGFNPVLKQEA